MKTATVQGGSERRSQQTAEILNCSERSERSEQLDERNAVLPAYGSEGHLGNGLNGLNALNGEDSLGSTTLCPERLVTHALNGGQPQAQKAARRIDTDALLSTADQCQLSPAVRLAVVNLLADAIVLSVRAGMAESGGGLEHSTDDANESGAFTSMGYRNRGRGAPTQDRGVASADPSVSTRA